MDRRKEDERWLQSYLASPIDPEPLRRFRHAMEEMQRVFIQRDEAIRLAFAAMLIGHNAFYLSAPGEAKTAICTLIGRFVKGWRTFVVELFPGTPPDYVFGPPDIRHLDETGFIRYNTEGMLPKAHFAFVDEIFHGGNPMVVQGLASILNPDQRIFTNAGEEQGCDTFTVLAAANPPLPNFEEEELAGLKKIWDRFLFRHVPPAIEKKKDFMDLLEVELPKKLSYEITLEDLEGLQSVVQKVLMPDELREFRWDLKKALRDAGIWISPRRWVWTRDALRASALLDWRSRVIDEDMLILRHVLWNDPVERKLVAGLIVKVVFPCLFEAKLKEKQAEEQLELARAEAEAGKSVREPVVEIRKIYEQVSALLPKARYGYEKQQIRGDVLARIERIEVEIQGIAASSESG